MSCFCAKRTDEYHGWECSITEGACMFLNPDSKRCAEEYGEGPDAVHKSEETAEKSNTDLEKMVVTAKDIVDKTASFEGVGLKEIPTKHQKYIDYLNNLKPGSIKNIYGSDSNLAANLSVVSHLMGKFDLEESEAIKIVVEWCKSESND